jgi:hypothetical protein
VQFGVSFPRNRNRNIDGRLPHYGTMFKICDVRCREHALAMLTSGTFTRPGPQIIIFVLPKRPFEPPRSDMTVVTSPI